MSANRRYQNLSNGLLKLLFFCAVIWIGVRAAQIQKAAAPADGEKEAAVVLRVIDGDTLLIDRNRRVRLLGVDTPETKHPDLPPEPYGAEATQFTARLVEGKRVQLVFDKERFDDYHRILAFVYLDDGTFLNEELVRAGLATAEPQYPFRGDIKKQLIAAEDLAKSMGIGIWTVGTK